MKHVAYFGDGEYTFALTPPMIRELEQKTGTGFGALYRKFAGNTFAYGDIIETIRLGLIGGGTAPIDAQRLVDTYAHNRPILETLPLAFDILDARYVGKVETVSQPDAQPDQKEEAPE